MTRKEKIRKLETVYAQLNRPSGHVVNTAKSITRVSLPSDTIELLLLLVTQGLSFERAMAFAESKPPRRDPSERDLDLDAEEKRIAEATK